MQSALKLSRLGMQLAPLRYQRPFPSCVGVGGGVEASTATAIPSRNSATATGDIEFVAIESNAGEPGTISTAGWTQVVDSPVQASDTSLALWWHRYTAGDGLPTINDVGDHMVAYIFAFRGCGLNGRVPIVATSVATQASGTSATIPDVVSPVPNALIAAWVGMGRDVNATDANTQTYWRGDVISLRREFDRTSVIGAGGGFALAVGYMAEPGLVSGITTSLGANLAATMFAVVLR